MEDDVLARRITEQKKANLKRRKKGLPTAVYSLLEEKDSDYANGERYSFCEKCGKEFKQEFIAQHNRYQNFKTCHGCRRISKVTGQQEDKKQKAMLTYSPYPWQMNMHKDIASHHIGVLACGARTGKDFACMMEVVNQIDQLQSENRMMMSQSPDPKVRKDPRASMVPAYRIWLIGPTERILEQNWQYAKKFIPKEFLANGYKSIKESDMKIELIGGGLLEVRSAYDEENLVGVAVDFCVVTEAARIRNLDRVWVNIEARLMSPGSGVGGKGGRALVNSSPRGKNFFYKMYLWGQKNSPLYSSHFFSYQLSTDENPDVKAEMDEIIKGFNGIEKTRRQDRRERWGERWYRQDYLAEFVDGGGVAFPDFETNCVVNPYAEKPGIKREEVKAMIEEWQAPKVGVSYRIGYDPASGSSGDSPIIAIREETTMRVVRFVDLYGKKDDDQLDAVAWWSRHYNGAEVCGLVLGYPHIENGLKQRGCMFTPLNEQGQGKRRLVQSLQRAVQNKQVLCLNDGSHEIESCVFQMEDYTENEKTGKFSNETTGGHDDYVSALYACYHDYSEVPEITSHYTGLMGGVPRKKV